MKTMINQLVKTAAFQTVVNEKTEKEVQSTQESSENVTADVMSQDAEGTTGDAFVPEEESAGDSATEDTVEGMTEGETEADMTGTNASEDGAQDMQGDAEGMDVSEDMMAEDGMADAMGTQTGTQANGSVLASYPFVIGISAATLVLSIVIGILLAKRKIKKGLDLYED